ncbi:uncharacterized protein LOC144129559 [Amblyomma americanum]
MDQAGWIRRSMLLVLVSGSWAGNYADVKLYAVDIIKQSGMDLWSNKTEPPLPNCSIVVAAPKQRIPSTVVNLHSGVHYARGHDIMSIRGECSDPAEIDGEVTFGCYVRQDSTYITFRGQCIRPLVDEEIHVEFMLSPIDMLLEFKKREGKLPRVSELEVVEVLCTLIEPINANSDIFLQDETAFAYFSTTITQTCCIEMLREHLEKKYRFILEGYLRARSAKFPMP